MTSCHASSPMRSRRVSWVTPALATRISTGPNASSTAAKAESTWAGSQTSQGTARRSMVPGPPDSSSGGALR